MGSTSGLERLEVADTSHFEEGGGRVWAWSVKGRRLATAWRTLADVEADITQVILVRLDRTVLLNPMAVRRLEPLFGGRSLAVLASGAEFKAGRAQTKQLKFLLGI